MLPALSLDNMTRQRPKGTHAGRTVAARRNYLGKSQPNIESETNGVIYVKLLSRIETGKQSLGSLSSHKLGFLIRALEWTNQEFTEATGVSVGYDPKPIPTAEPYVPSVQVPIYDSVSAGLSAATGGDSQVKDYLGLDTRLPNLRGRNHDRLVVMPVNGDSMVSPKAHESIPEGSLVVVEVGAIPQHSDVVVAWIEDENLAVLKRYEEGSDVVLTSYNPNGPVFRFGEKQAEIRGVVRLVMRKP